MKSRSGLVIVVFGVLLLAGVLYSRMTAKAPETNHEPGARVEMDALPTAPSAASPGASPSASATPASGAASSSPNTDSVSPVAGVSSVNGSVAVNQGGRVVSPALDAEFTQATSQALAAIPTQAQLRGLPHEKTHFTPPELFNAANSIGGVSDLVREHPELAMKGLEFYKQCAEMKTSPESVRASCLVDFKKLQIKSGISSPLPKVTERVAALAKDLMP